MLRSDKFRKVELLGQSYQKLKTKQWITCNSLVIHITQPGMTLVLIPQQL